MRLKWLDTARGIGIILVVLGHTWSLGLGEKYIFAFHMPLFFLLSGCVYNTDKYNNIVLLVKNKFRTLIVPYFFFASVTYFYWLVIERKLNPYPTAITPANAIINTLISQGSGDYIPHNPAIWFLTCLFIVQIMFYLITKCKKVVAIALLLILCSIIGYILYKNIPSSLPWSIDVAFSGVVFFGIGFFFKDIISRNSYNLPLVTLMLIPVFLVSVYYNIRVSMGSNILGNYFLFYISGLSGSVIIINISFLLSGLKTLDYFGKNSLIILGLHFPVKRVAQGISSIVFDISLDKVQKSILISSLDTVVTLLIMVPIILILNNYFIFIFQKKRFNLVK